MIVFNMAWEIEGFVFKELVVKGGRLVSTYPEYSPAVAWEAYKHIVSVLMAQGAYAPLPITAKLVLSLSYILVGLYLGYDMIKPLRLRVALRCCTFSPVYRIVDVPVVSFLRTFRAHFHYCDYSITRGNVSPVLPGLRLNPNYDPELSGKGQVLMSAFMRNWRNVYDYRFYTMPDDYSGTEYSYCITTNEPVLNDEVERSSESYVIRPTTRLVLFFNADFVLKGKATAGYTYMVFPGVDNNCPRANIERLAEAVIKHQTVYRYGVDVRGIWFVRLVSFREAMFVRGAVTSIPVSGAGNG